MPRTTTEATIQALQDVFARYGIPEILVSDNGPQFTSVESEVGTLSPKVKSCGREVCPNI